MSRISDEVDKLREAANQSHSGLVRAKREADKMHSRYIVALKCMHSMSDLVYAMKTKESGGEIEGSDEQRTGVSDIMEQCRALFHGRPDDDSAKGRSLILH